MKNKERNERFLAIRDGLRRFVDGEIEPLERAMEKSQTREPDPVDVFPDERAEAMAAEAAEAQRVARELEKWNRKKGGRHAHRLYVALCVATCLTLIALLLVAVAHMPSYGSPGHPINNEVSRRYIESGLQETGAVNIVTGMILDYRAFDTLGESTVLFTAAMVVLFLLRMDRESQKYSPLAREMRESPIADNFYEPHGDAILSRIAAVLSPAIMLMGVYVVLNGHLSPGGGFSGGAIMGAALILYVTGFGFASIRRFFTYKTYQRIVLLALLTYAVSKCYSFYTGANHIESVIPLGAPGAILSSGLILVLNICVGFIVCCTMYAFYAVFRKGEL